MNKRREYVKLGFLRVDMQFKSETFGRLTTIGPAFRMSNDKNQTGWFHVCECICGNVKVIKYQNLTSGSIVSCGCHIRQVTSKRAKRHGMLKSPTYVTWKSMKSRCYNKNMNNHEDYGGRGIKVCDRWLEPDGRGFMNFLEDMGERPSTKHSIDRIDVNGDYEPSNCKWATDIEQALNRRDTLYVNAFGKNKTLKEFCFLYKIDYYRVWNRIFTQGWSVEKALTTPILQRKKPNT